jgi:hypothetical protein
MRAWWNGGYLSLQIKVRKEGEQAFASIGGQDCCFLRPKPKPVQHAPPSYTVPPPDAPRGPNVVETADGQYIVAGMRNPRTKRIEPMGSRNEEWWDRWFDSEQWHEEMNKRRKGGMPS